MSDETSPKAPRTYNWLKLYAVLPRNPKIAGLSDSEFRTFIYALCSAREQDIVGEWQDLNYLVAALPKRLVKHVQTLLDRELIVSNDDGSAQPHKWSYWQPKDYGAAERKAQSRASHRDVTDKSHGIEETRRDATRRERTGSDADGFGSVAGSPNGPSPSPCVLCDKPLTGPSKPTTWNGQDGEAHPECLRVLTR